MEEYDQLRMLHSLGFEVASIGGYVDPAHPHDPKRPALPQIPCYPELKEAVDNAGGPGMDNLGIAQAHIPDAILDWLGDTGVIIFHHYLDQRLFPQWEHLREWRESGGRVIWRTVGQSVEHNERMAQPYRADGLEIVRYSPKERNIPGYAGEDALIRFYKDPAEWHGWTGDREVVVNVTQHLKARDPYTNWRFWEPATAGLPRMPLGPGSEEIGGPGELTFDEMQGWLRRARCYLYTGTQPASYTLGLLEAMMTGIPVVSIGPSHMNVFPYGPQLFEGHELSCLWSDDPETARAMVAALLQDEEKAREWSMVQRSQAIETFGVDTIAAQWREFLGTP